MADAGEFGDLCPWQQSNRLAQNVTPRDRIVETPHQVQRSLPAAHRFLPSLMVDSAFGVVPDEKVRQLVAVVG
jgi:hypothetical protein